MQQFQKHAFTGGLNSDVELRLIPEGDYLFAENIYTLSTESGNQGVVQTVKGNKLILLPDLFSDTQFVTVGAFEDRARQKVYFFDCDITPNRAEDQRKHTIFLLDNATKLVSVIVTSPALNFSKEYLVTHIRTIENLLFWTDNYNPPRQINVNRFLIPASYPLSEFHFSLGKYPPLAPVYVSSGYTLNAILLEDQEKREKGIWQFTHRYVYKDGQKSTFAPYSLVQYGYLSPSYDGLFLHRFSQVCGLLSSELATTQGVDSLPYSRFADEIDTIEIYTRSSQYLPFQLAYQQKASDFAQSIAIGKQPPQTLVIADNEITQLFDAVPFQSVAMEIADNRVFLANNTEELPLIDNFDVEQVELYYNQNWHAVSLSDTTDAALPVTDPNLGQWLTFKAGGTYQLGIIFHDQAGRTSGVYTKESLKVQFDHLVAENSQTLISAASAKFGFPVQNIDRQGVQTSPTLIVFTNDNNPALGYYDGSNNNYSPSTGIHQISVAGTYSVRGRLAIYHRNNRDRDFYVRLYVNGTQQAEQRFTQSTDIGGRTDHYNFFFLNQSFALGDQITIRMSREAGAYRSELERSSNTFCEIKLLKPLTTAQPVYECAVGFKFSDAFTPPDWAVAYQVVRTDCLNYEFFIQAFSGKFYWYQTDPADENKRKRIDTYTTTDQQKATFMYIRIKAWYADAYSVPDKSKSNPPNQIYYNYQQGDKVALYLSGKRYVFDILEFTDDCLVIKRPSLSIPEQNSLFVEVFREKQLSTSPFFYECSEFYPILYPKTNIRQWSKSDWRYTNNAVVTRQFLPGGYVINHNLPMYFGDVHLIKKTFYIEGNDNPINPVDTISPTYTQSMHPDSSKIWDRWEHAGGRVNVALQTLSATQTKASQIRYSEPFVTDSLINNTNRFYQENQSFLPVSFGGITSLQVANNQDSAGTIMLALTENEAVSIYVNRRRLEDLSGNTNLTESDNVIGSFNPLAGSYGCKNPESVVAYSGKVYYYCHNKGVVCRYGGDGLTPISDYGMKSFFLNRSRQMGPNSTFRVFAGFDPSQTKQQYFLSFVDETINEKQTIAFSEVANRWESFYSFVGEYYISSSTFLVSFKAGKPYFHGLGNYNQFYGYVFDSKLELVSNQNPSMVKVFQNISTESSHPWQVERFSTDNGQTSFLETRNMKRLENHYYAQILRDTNSKGGIINGNVMRDTAMRTLLILIPPTNELSTLRFVNIGFIESKFHFA